MDTERVVTILKAMSNSNYDMACYFRDTGDTDEYGKYMARTTAIDSAVFILTDSDFANKMWDIFCEKS